MVLKSLNSLNNDVERNLKLTISPAIIEDTKEISAILAQSFYSFPEFAHWIYPFLRFTINEDLRYRLRLTSPHYRCLVAKMIPSSNDGQNINDSESVIVGTIEVTLRSAIWQTSPQYPYISACEQAALDWGYRETRLHVLDCNESAKQLYCQNGYQISQIEPNWGSLWFDYSPRLLLKKIIQTPQN
jgi:hypothetical protein